MTPEITIMDTKPYHLRLMADAMSADSVEVAKKLGSTPLKAMWITYRNAMICKSGFINDKIAAIFGISGTIFSETGKPFLIMTPEVEKHPLRVAFIYRRMLNNFQKMFPYLEEWVPEDNEKSIRLLELMGFKVNKNTVKIGEQVFRHAERRA